MLNIPELKFDYSAKQSNVDTNALGDWIEACTLFDDRVLSKSDVVDLLLESQVCTDENQDLAHLIADEGWSEITRRKRWGGIPKHVTITPTRITSSISWDEDPIRSFFVLLSILRIYPEWAKPYQEYGVQGDLFEKVVELICPALLPGWTTYRAGWSPDDTKNIPGIVKELSERLYVPGASNLDRWLMSAGNDGGLDIVCYRSFSDEREAGPIFFLQCASGKNWREKINTPNADAWQKYLDSAVRPSTGIVAPFVIEDKELRVAALSGQIVVFDRIRMLSAANSNGVVLDDDFKKEIITWLKRRVNALPRVV